MQLMFCLCVLVTSEGDPCVFPFTIMNKTYNECTTEQLTGGRKWCATTADYHKDKKWGFCNQGDWW